VDVLVVSRPWVSLALSADLVAMALAGARLQSLLCFVWITDNAMSCAPVRNLGEMSGNTAGEVFLI